MVALNAGCALYVAGVTASWAEGVWRSLEVLASGAGLRKLDEWVRRSGELALLERSGGLVTLERDS